MKNPLPSLRLFQSTMKHGNCQGVVGNFMNFMVVIITVVMCVIWTD